MALPLFNTHTHTTTKHALPETNFLFHHHMSDVMQYSANLKIVITVKDHILIGSDCMVLICLLSFVQVQFFTVGYFVILTFLDI